MLSDSPQLTAAPTNVEGFCSHVVWRIPSGVSCEEVDHYEVRLYNPTTGQEDTRISPADGTFYSLPKSGNEAFQHKDTQFQVSGLSI